MSTANYDTVSQVAPAGSTGPRNIGGRQAGGSSAGIEGVTVEREEDVAAVIAVIAALASVSTAPSEPGPATRSVWADPARRLGQRSASATAWWASGLPR